MTRIWSAVLPHNTGDGLLMAEAVGAANGHMSTLYIGPHNHPANIRIGNIMRRPMMMYLNRNGERFVDEAVSQYEDWAMDAGYGHRTPTRPDVLPIDGRVHFPRDAEKKGKLNCVIEGPQGTSKRQYMLEKYGENVPSLESGRDDPCAWLDKLEDDFKNEIARGEDSRMAIFDTLNEVAAYIGADPEVLKTTVKEYNLFCKHQYDADFLKPAEYLWPLTTAPYYIFKGYQAIDICIGGILIDHNMRVLDKEHRPIKNLYAVGACTSGWVNNGYSFMGTCLSIALFGGYSAGKLAAEEAMK